MTTSTTSADRDVDQEDPVPAEVIRDQPAERRPDQGRHAEHGPEEALVPAALRRREDVTDHRQRHREEGAGTQSLDAAEHDELPHLLRQAAQHRTDQEDADPDGEDDPPPEDVGQLSVDRTADRGRQQVSGERPHVDVVALQLADDHGQGGAHDRLVERRQEDSQQDGDQDLDALPVGQLDGCDVVVGWALRLLRGRGVGGHGRSDLQWGSARWKDTRAGSDVTRALEIVALSMTASGASPHRSGRAAWLHA